MDYQTAFKQELKEHIITESIRKLLDEAFSALTPEYFWTVPAATSGRYHPELAQGKGGLVRHVKYAVWWASELMEAYIVPQPFREEVIAALLIHDLIKNGAELNSQGYAAEKDAASKHGLWLYQLLTELPSYNEHDPSHVRIAVAVAGHMGRWTSKEGLVFFFKNLADESMRLVSEMVHMADYCASRRYSTKVNEITQQYPG